MNRNDITTISNLIVGDIFYKQGDAKKNKLQVHKHDHANKRVVCVDPEIQGPAREKEFLQKWLKPDTRVIFLRRTQHTDIGDPSVLIPTETKATVATVVLAMLLLFAQTMAGTTATAQPVFNIGVGLSSKEIDPTGMIEMGGRIGPLLYTGAQLRAYSHGYPTMTGSALLGAAWSWNNGKMHDLTTVWYAKVDWAIVATDEFKANPPSPFGFGLRHYVYNAFVDVGYQPKQIVLTIGYSFGNIYK